MIVQVFTCIEVQLLKACLLLNQVMNLDVNLKQIKH